MSVDLDLGLVFVHSFRFSMLCAFFWFSIDYCVLVSIVFFVLDLVSSVLCQEIGWEELLQSDPFYVKWDVKP